MSMDRTFTCHGSSFLPVSLFVLLAFGIAQLQAQTLIYSLPFFILFPAKYRLVKNLTYEGKQGSAIMILSSNVDLDLNGCALKETAADNQSIGVLIDHQQNVTIRNGKIQGFKQAIVFDDHTKQITWPGNDLASHNVAIQSVDASQEAPVDAERKPQTPATSEQPKVLRTLVLLRKFLVGSSTDTTRPKVHRKLLRVLCITGIGRITNDNEHQRTSTTVNVSWRSLSFVAIPAMH